MDGGVVSGLIGPKRLKPQVLHSGSNICNPGPASHVHINTHSCSDFFHGAKTKCEELNVGDAPGSCVRPCSVSESQNPAQEFYHN